VPTHGNIRNYYIILAENMEEVRLDTRPSFIVVATMVDLLNQGTLKKKQLVGIIITILIFMSC
jgi:hypothetical protein